MRKTNKELNDEVNPSVYKSIVDCIFNHCTSKIKAVLKSKRDEQIAKIESKKSTVLYKIGDGHREKIIISYRYNESDKQFYPLIRKETLRIDSELSSKDLFRLTKKLLNFFEKNMNLKVEVWENNWK